MIVINQPAAAQAWWSLGGGSPNPRPLYFSSFDFHGIFRHIQY